MRRQRGVAVITALLLTTLAVTIVASLFWRQQVQVRSLENQRLQLQTQWVLRGTLDWARRQLREDSRTSSVDHLGEAWAAPMAETRLDGYLDSDTADPKAKPGDDLDHPTMSGNIVDAQSMFNLNNLVHARVPDLRELTIYQHLLANLRLDPALAKVTVDALVATQKAVVVVPPEPSAGSAEAPSAPPPQTPAAPAPVLASLTRIDDLLTVPGYTRDIVDKLKNYVIILPDATSVNANTASAEVLAAVMGKGVTEIAPLIAGRGQAYFKDVGDLENRAQIPQEPGMINVESTYFLVNGTVHINRARLDMQALIYRKKTGNTTVKWMRTF